MFAGVIHIYAKGGANPIRTIDLKDLWADLNGTEIGRVLFAGGVDVVDGAAANITTNGTVDLHSNGAGSAAGGRTGEADWFSGTINAVV